MRPLGQVSDSSSAMTGASTVSGGLGVKPPEKMAGRVQPCVDDGNGFLGGSKPDFAGSTGTKKPAVFLAPQHGQPPPGSVPASPTLRTHPSHHPGQTAPIAG